MLNNVELVRFINPSRHEVESTVEYDARNNTTLVHFVFPFAKGFLADAGGIAIWCEEPASKRTVLVSADLEYEMLGGFQPFPYNRIAEGSIRPYKGVFVGLSMLDVVSNMAGSEESRVVGTDFKEYGKMKAEGNSLIVVGDAVYGVQRDMVGRQLLVGGAIERPIHHSICPASMVAMSDELIIALSDCGDQMYAIDLSRLADETSAYSGPGDDSPRHFNTPHHQAIGLDPGREIIARTARPFVQDGSTSIVAMGKDRRTVYRIDHDWGEPVAHLDTRILGEFPVAVNENTMIQFLDGVAAAYQDQGELVVSALLPDGKGYEARIVHLHEVALNSEIDRLFARRAF